MNYDTFRASFVSSGDLDLWPSDLKIAWPITSVMCNLTCVLKFELSEVFRPRVKGTCSTDERSMDCGQTDRQTDRRTDDGDQSLMVSHMRRGNRRHTNSYTNCGRDEITDGLPTGQEVDISVKMRKTCRVDGSNLLCAVPRVSCIFIAVVRSCRRLAIHCWS